MNVQECRQCKRIFDIGTLFEQGLCPVCQNKSGEYRRCPVCKIFNNSLIDNCVNCKLILKNAEILTPAKIVEQYPVLLIKQLKNDKQFLEI